MKVSRHSAFHEHRACWKVGFGWAASLAVRKEPGPLRRIQRGLPGFRRLQQESRPVIRCSPAIQRPLRSCSPSEREIHQPASPSRHGQLLLRDILASNGRLAGAGTAAGTRTARASSAVRTGSCRGGLPITDRAKSRVTGIRTGIRSRSVLRVVKRIVLADSIGVWPRIPTPAPIMSLARCSRRHPSLQWTNMQKLMSDQEVQRGSSHVTVVIAQHAYFVTRLLARSVPLGCSPYEAPRPDG